MIDHEFHLLKTRAKESGCAKKQVVAGTWARCGPKPPEFIYATNYCVHEGEECPRLDMPSGEGYELCDAKHAEADLAKKIIDQGLTICSETVWVFGHYWACEACATDLKELGIKELRVREFYE